jgi:hypothetical protein
MTWPSRLVPWVRSWSSSGSSQPTNGASWIEPSPWCDLRCAGTVRPARWHQLTPPNTALLSVRQQR